MSNAWLYSVVLAWVSPLKSRLKVSTFSAELPLKERSVATINSHPWTWPCHPFFFLVAMVLLDMLQ